MKEFSEFLHMGGFAFYVWSAYSLAVIILVVNAVLPMLCRRRLLAEVRMEEE